ncbi:outer membrane beta-barrel protein [Mucilaginibacter sp.]|uniref:outer membrane beta-barrel protein n=1 Tax=Mucilaginibacter sp. TaxID=1882438 RepID=UPI003B003872
MKRFLMLSTFLFCLFSNAFAQVKTDTIPGSNAPADSDSAKYYKTNRKIIKFRLKLDSLRARPLPITTVGSKLHFGIIFSHFDLGFSRLVDNGSFTLSPANKFLDYKGGKTAYVGFDVLQLGYRFNPYFKIYLAGGFDWTLIRLRQNITIQQNAPTLTYTTDQVDYSKNRFSASYLRIPLAFDFRTKDDKRGNKFRFTVGPEIGFLLNGKVKQISGEMGKKKFYDNYHFSQFRYGAYARAGYKNLGLFVKYYGNNMFENSPNQNGLKSMHFGLTFGL